MIQDIDLDVNSLFEKLPDDNVVFSFRAGPEPPGFVYMKGDMGSLIDVLVTLMDQHDEIAELVINAASDYETD